MKFRIRHAWSAFYLNSIFVTASLSVSCDAQETFPGLSPDGKGCLTASGKFEPHDVPAENRESAEILKDLGIKIEEHIMIGQVDLNTRTRCISFPATVNMVDGPIEYLLVNNRGKVHESLLVTTALPRDIHAACLLAGWGNSNEGGVLGNVSINVGWKGNGPEHSEAIDKLVLYSKDNPQGKSGCPLQPEPWIYGGSPTAAIREGSIISMIRDPSALIFNPRPGRDDDTLHVPNAGLLPQMGLPVRILIRLLPNMLESQKPSPPSP